MGEIAILLIDGKFKISPTNSRQVWTIHGLHIHKFYPLIYFILPDKSTSTYKIAFKMITERIQLDQEYIITDFEFGLINSLKKTFTNSKFGG